MTRIEIDKGLGVHICDQCKSALTDADFVVCGVPVNAEPGLCFDYLCPKCAYSGRYTIALIQAVPSVAVALETLKDAVHDLVAPPIRRGSRMHRRDRGRLDQFLNEL